MVDRIQKLLCSEYKDFNDFVILESLFAETTRDGNGIMQVQIGLTGSKLILAALYPGAQQDPREKCPKDPELECMELVSLTPIEMVNLTVFRRRTRNTIKAHFTNDTIKYYELASPTRREMFWKLWLEKLRSLAPQPMSSTQSETSVGSSSSAISILHGDGPSSNSITWPIRDVYLGDKFGMGESKRKKLPTGSLHIPREIETEIIPLKRRKDKTRVFPVNRFGSGVDERCCTSLFLPIQVTTPPKFEFSLHSYEYYKDKWAMLAWEDVPGRRDWEPPVPRVTPLHPRKYGLAMLPQFLHGLGLWTLSPADAATTQLRKVSSCVSLNSARKNDMSLEIPKRLLVSGISCENIHRYEDQTRPWFLFWTPGYWHKPCNAPASYLKLRQHIHQVHTYIKESIKKKTWFPKYPMVNTHKKKWKKLKGSSSENLANKDIRNRLKIDIKLTSWDFDSTLIAHQITLIDRELFMRIPVEELLVLVRERNSRNTPNLRDVIAFSNRIMNLITTEIIRIDSIKLRSRLMARWINVADKLYRLQNLQGCWNVLLGLQSPGVFRLTETWSCLRKYHNTKYRRLLTLLRLNVEPRSESYGKMMERITKVTPYLPSMDFLIAVLLAWTPPAPTITSLSPEEDVRRLWNCWTTAAGSYKLTDTPLAKEFLTKTRYLEEMENFALASQLEGMVLNQ